MTWLEVASRLGIGGGFGFLAGIMLVSWVQPTTTEGMALLVLVATVFGTSTGGILGKILGKPTSTTPKANYNPREDD